MQIRLLRNATLIVQVGAQHLLVDPMLGPAGSLPPLSVLRHPPRRNPLLPLPNNVQPMLANVTAGLITHCRWGHADHLDRAGTRWLAESGVPVYCQRPDASYLRRRGINAVPVLPGLPHHWAGGQFTAIPTQHGYRFIGRLMGPGVGYLIEMPGEPTLYISGDTVLTDVVRNVLRDVRPDVVVVAAGGAQLDIGSPILMPIQEVLDCIALAPKLVIANHLEALNHCPVTRAELATAVANAGLSHKVYIPEDGESIVVTSEMLRLSSSSASV